ncbi:MAG: hypothetical protein ACRDTJ_01215, partial [Pseudonocardiaceae bacterium]
ACAVRPAPSGPDNGPNGVTAGPPGPLGAHGWSPDRQEATADVVKPRERPARGAPRPYVDRPGPLLAA